MGYSVALLLAFHFIVENIDGVQVSTGELVELNLCDSEKRKEKKHAAHLFNGISART